jgi:hypothetical protein
LVFAVRFFFKVGVGGFPQKDKFYMKEKQEGYKNTGLYKLVNVTYNESVYSQDDSYDASSVEDQFQIFFMAIKH